MKNPILFIIACLCLFTFGDCQKKLFARVHVKGRLLNYFTHEPIKGLSVSLLAYDAHSAKDSQTGAIGIATSVTDANGGYDLEGKASKRNSYHIRTTIKGDNYMENLYVAGGTSSSSGITLPNKIVKQIDDFETGIIIFYCRVNLEINSASRSVEIDGKKYTGSTSFMDRLTYDKTTYDRNKKMYFRSYSVLKGGAKTHTSFSGPIAYPDTSVVNLTF